MYHNFIYVQRTHVLLKLHEYIWFVQTHLNPLWVSNGLACCSPTNSDKRPLYFTLGFAYPSFGHNVSHFNHPLSLCLVLYLLLYCGCLFCVLGSRKYWGSDCCIGGQLDKYGVWICLQITFQGNTHAHTRMHAHTLRHKTKTTVCLNN